jgi:predicted DNA-binding protein
VPAEKLPDLSLCAEQLPAAYAVYVHCTYNVITFQGVFMSAVKDETITFRIEPELKSAFIDAAKDAHRPVGQVLREFMRNYVEKAKDQKLPVENDRFARDSTQRRKSIEFANASVELEGFKLNKADADLSNKYIEGEITLADAIKVVRTTYLER